jgi:hypothetical protein
VIQFRAPAVIKREMTKGKRQRQRDKRAQAEQAGQPGGVSIRAEEAKAEWNQIQKAYSQATEHESEGNVDMAAKREIGEWIRNNANPVIALFTIVIAAIAIIQAFIYKAQLDEMRIDQRAWVAAKFINLAGPTVGQILPAPLIVGNIGKTVAKNLDGWIYFRPVPISTTIDLSDPATLKPSSVASGEPIPAWTHYAAGVLYPNDIGPVVGAALVNTPTGKTSPVPTVWDGILQDKWDKGDIYLAIDGKITYEDAGGIKHWTTFCYTYTSPASGKFVSMDTVDACKSYMTVDGNK